jgi:hypothetical protein
MNQQDQFPAPQFKTPLLNCQPYLLKGASVGKEFSFFSLFKLFQLDHLFDGLRNRYPTALAFLSYRSNGPI